MAAIVADVAPTLKAAGFRKRRYAFNRATTGGLVHVVKLWMAPKEPPAWTEVPGLRERQYGEFYLECGVWVPEMTRLGEPRGNWINEYDCQLRTGMVYCAPYDAFEWQLDDPHAAHKALTALREYGLPWLAKFPDHAAILSEFDQLDESGKFRPFNLGMQPNGALDIAQMCDRIGQPERARQILRDYVSHPVTNPEYLQRYLVEAGHPDLAEYVVEAP
ncbi:hypothetical protein GCM10009657_17130 [Oryzihumus leptocrescens]